MEKILKTDYERRCNFSSGDKGNEIALLLESPGDEEVKRGRPLIGSAFLSYEVIRGVVALKNKYCLASALSRDRVMILNTWPEKLDGPTRGRVVRNIRKGNLNYVAEIIARKINAIRRVICVGEVACEFYNVILETGLSKARTAVYLPYFGGHGLGCLNIQPQDSRRNVVLHKLELIGDHLSRCIVKDGYFGWNDMRTAWEGSTGEKILWSGKDKAPEWLNPPCRSDASLKLGGER